MMTFPTEWKVIKFHGSSHHQPDENPRFLAAFLLPLHFARTSILHQPTTKWNSWIAWKSYPGVTWLAGKIRKSPINRH
jgi:hypothetical protein